ncbi:MAG: choice-of-anchor J domain-containing protein [bacterium]|nr:choice-of-anchor J domain-containing protein [bacterium]
MIQLALFILAFLWAALPLQATPLAHKLAAPASNKTSMGVRESAHSGETWGRSGRTTLDESLLAEDFEAVAPGELPDGWIQADGDGGYCSWFAALSQWRVVRRDDFPAHSGRKIIFCHYNDQALPNDDWLILPRVHAGGLLTLRYWAASQDPSYPESYEVRVSTVGTAPSDFTALIHTETAVPSDWTPREHDLSAYANQPFYVAFHYMAANRFALKLDDVELEGEPVNVGWITGIVTNDSAETVAGARVTIAELGRSAWTDSTGMYILPMISAGNHSLEFYHKHHLPYPAAQVTVAADETTRVDAVFEKRLLRFYNHWYGLSPEPIRDFDTTGIWLNISDTALVYDVDVTVSLTHPRVGDLEIWLQWVDTTRVPLVHADLYQTGADVIHCVFDDDAPLPFAAGEPPYTGAWRPAQPLSTLDGDSISIIRNDIRYRTHWLYVYDGAARDEGFLSGFFYRLATPYALLRGTVTDAVSGLALDSVTVFFHNSRRDLDTLTTADGRYLFPVIPIPSGIGSARFEREGYETLTRIVNPLAGAPTELNVQLAPIVSAQEVIAPFEFRFDGCYPNPFNAQTRIRFSLPQAAAVTITLYNVLGEVAAEPLDGWLTPGEYEVPLRADGLASGVYLIHLRAGEHQSLRKAVMLK